MNPESGRSSHSGGGGRGRDDAAQQQPQQQQEQVELDPFGLPLGGPGPKEELDLEDLEPRMRSVAVGARPQQRGLVMGGGRGSGSLPSYHDRHRGAYLHRESGGPKMSEPAPPQPLHKPGTTSVAPLPIRPNVADAGGGLAAPTLPFDTALFPLERCHYYTNKTGPELFEGIEAALQKTGVSFQFAPEKFKFTCEYLAGGEEGLVVRFVCRAYFVPEDGRTVVEFQRRAGCCIACAKVVGAVRSTLLLREGNAAAAAVPVKPFWARPFSLPECAAHSFSALSPEEEAVLRARAAEQQCKVMADIGVCLDAGPDGQQLLDGLARVLVPLSQLSPDHLLSDPAYADLLARLVGASASGGARLAALSCLANLAATCFGADAQRRLSGGKAAEAWFGRSLGAAVGVLASGGADPHAQREATRALMHAARASVGAGVLRASPQGMAALRRAAAAAASPTHDRLLQGYAQATLRALEGSFASVAASSSLA